MANCHDLFRSFMGQIDFDPSKRDSLKSAREGLRKRIKTHFKDTLKTKVPGFCGQGSYMMATIINPLDGEYDIDDGVYLMNIDPQKSKWPDPQTVHGWILDAVKGHTKQDPINKKTCIRVIYSGKWHVDLPIYGIFQDKAYLAEVGDEGWHISEPTSFTKWFKEQIKSKGEQVRDMVKYFKGWLDLHSQKEGKMICGFLATILVTKHYFKHDRDDVCFSSTMKNIYEAVSTDFSIVNPVNGGLLSNEVEDSEKKRFIKSLGTLVDNASKALDEIDKKKACKIWKSEFGDRFFDCDKLEDGKGALRTCAPAILKDDARSAKINVKRIL